MATKASRGHGPVFNSGWPATVVLRPARKLLRPARKLGRERPKNRDCRGQRPVRLKIARKRSKWDTTQDFLWLTTRPAVNARQFLSELKRGSQESPGGDVLSCLHRSMPVKEEPRVEWAQEKKAPGIAVAEVRRDSPSTSPRRPGHFTAHAGIAAII